MDKIGNKKIIEKKVWRTFLKWLKLKVGIFRGIANIFNSKVRN